MEFSFLGTSSGVPTKQRNVSGLVIKQTQEKSWCLVDCGEGTQHQLLYTPFSLVNMEAIFITHVHGDHCYGLPGLLATAAMHGRRAKLTIIAPTGVEAFVSTCIQHTAMFLPYEITFVDVAEFSSFSSGNFEVEIIKLSHRVPSYAFKFKSAELAPRLDTDKLLREGVPQGPLWGQMLKQAEVELPGGRVLKSSDFLLKPSEPRAVIIGGDNDSPELLAPYMGDVDVLVHEATYTQKISDQVGPGPQHCSAQKVACFAESQQLKNLVLTHFSARYHGSSKGESVAAIAQEARSFYSGNLHMAEDFASFRLGVDGSVLDKIDLRIK